MFNNSESKNSWFKRSKKGRSKSGISGEKMKTKPI